MRRLLLALSGLFIYGHECLLSGVKRTSRRLAEMSANWYEQSGCYEHCSSKRPQSERYQNRPRRGPAALSSLWTSAWLIAASLFIGPDLFWGRGDI